jgi:two-component system sensor histidine kinase/response regulator
MGWNPIDVRSNNELPMNIAMLPPIKILAVDDIASNLTALDAVLAKPEVDIVHASSGAAALELLLEHDFGLAILDVHMPEMDGFELAELMRGSKRTSHIPILFLTAAGQDAQRAFRGYASGAVDFLHKPIDARVLMAKVDVFVQLARQKQQLGEQLETTQQLLRTNEMLMAVLAHDLRTPLSAIIASTSFLDRFSSEEKIRPVTDRISRSSRRMARMVDQLLHVARLRGGRVQLSPLRGDAHALCAAIVDEYEASHGEGRIELERSGDAHAMIDADLLSQVLSNLIGNAFQHGEPGKPIVVVSDGAAPSSISISVTNGGVIDAATLPELFEAFRSGRDADLSEGLGLGLYITRELVALHGGEVHAGSNVQEGTTTFTVTLPRHARI